MDKEVLRAMVLRYGQQTGKCMAPDEREVGGECPPMRLLMSCALDDRLSASERAALSRHLAGCVACRAHSLELDAAHLLFCAVDHPPVAPLAPDLNFVRRVMARVRLGVAPPGGIREFARRVAQDATLHTQFRLAGDKESFVAQFVSAGQRQGYQFSGEEVACLFNAAHAANDDLSDAQLDAVVGGAGAHDASLRAFIDEFYQLFNPME